MKILLSILDQVRPLFEKGGKLERLFPLFEMKDTFLFTPPETTHTGAHVRDALDLKRFMSFVIIALIPCTVFGIWNAGYQYNISNHGAVHSEFPIRIMFDFLSGLPIVLPIIIVSYLVGGLWEVLFSVVRKHEINEGFLVTGLIFPLTLPPTTPLWQVAVAVSFGVVIGKEIFGGTGMNILNPALVGRAFLFIAYSKNMTGDVWVKLGHNNEIIQWFARHAPGNVTDIAPAFFSARTPLEAVDGYTGATPLGVLADLPEGVNAVEGLASNGFTFVNMLIGNIPGSIGETSAIMCLIGAAILLFMGVASWRIIFSAVAGCIVGGILTNFLSDSEAAQLPFYYHLVMGGFAYGAFFMLTDPVSAAATNLGKIIYGFMFGILVVLIRVFNPGFPECVMLVILFMNVVAPVIDNFVVESHIKRRKCRG